MMDIVERLALRVRDGNYELGDHPAVMEAEDTMLDARDEITRLRAENERLRADLDDCAQWMSTREKIIPGLERLCDRARSTLEETAILTEREDG